MMQSHPGMDTTMMDTTYVLRFQGEVVQEDPHEVVMEEVVDGEEEVVEGLEEEEVVVGHRLADPTTDVWCQVMGC